MINRKKILITGQGSYIGTNFKKWMEKTSKEYEIEELSVRNDKWKELDFSKFAAVLHVAGIAHVSADPNLEQLYYKVNRDLAIDVATKARNEGVKQFIFMSSMIIYGADSKVGENRIITLDTEPNPIDFYGRSKLEADIAIRKLNDEHFKTAIIRTPMVYGPNCKGNFPRLKKLAETLPIFPDISNQRSMIYIDNLCEFIKLVVNEGYGGVYFPQNKEYVSTQDIIKIMSEHMGKRMYFVKAFNPLLKVMSNRMNLVNKVWGSRVYSKDTVPNFEYCVVDFKNSIIKSM